MALEKLIVSQAEKWDIDPKPSALVDLDILEESGSEVVTELKHEPEPNNAA